MAILINPDDQPVNKFRDEQAEIIADLYVQIGNEVRNTLEEETSREVTATRRNVALASIALTLQQAQQETDKILARIIPLAYKFGIDEANALLPRRLRNEKLAPFHAEQVNILLSDASADFGVGLDGVRKAAGQTLSRVASEQLRIKIAEGVLSGSSIDTIQAGVFKEMRKAGFITFIRRDGKNMNLSDYARMLTRTHIIRVANEGTVKRANELGITIFEMSKHPNTPDKACLDIEGKLYDTSGKKYDKPPSLPIHPNCRHKLFPRPDLQ